MTRKICNASNIRPLRTAVRVAIAAGAATPE